MPPKTQITHWYIAAIATVVAGVGLVVLQPQWWQGVLFTLFQSGLILWLRPAPAPAPTNDLTETLTEDVNRLRIQLEEQKELLKRVLPLWGEQIQQAQDQLNMPGMQPINSATRSEVNLILDAARADMHRLCELNCYEHNHRHQADNWLSTFANTNSGARQTPIRSIASPAIKSTSLRSASARLF